MRQVKVGNLEVGDLVDLEYDLYADIQVGEMFEFVEVENVEKESKNCIRVDFVNYDSIGFPIDHFVIVKD